MFLTRYALTAHLRYLRWRWLRNISDSLSYAFSVRNLDLRSAEIVDKLRRDGIVATSNYPDQALFAAMQHEALGQVACAANRQTSESSAVDRKANRDSLGERESKEFLQILTPKTFAYDSVYLRYALQPEFIEIANSYLGLSARLRAIHVWLNRPTEYEPASTQLWHCDGDDLLNLKIFTYLTNVGPRNGPFAFIPGTQLRGYRQIKPESSELGRTTDLQMRGVVSESDWKVCTGDAGSVIFSDTSGYHKGVKPVEGYRVMLMLQYASRAAVTGSELQVQGNVPAWLARSQRIALGLYD